MANGAIPTLTITLFSQGAGQNGVELAFTRLTTAADRPPERGVAAFNPEALRQASNDAQAYGTLFAEGVFPKGKLDYFFKESLAVVQATVQPYRIRLRIDHNAPELHSIGGLISSIRVLFRRSRRVKLPWSSMLTWKFAFSN